MNTPTCPTCGTEFDLTDPWVVHDAHLHLRLHEQARIDAVLRPHPYAAARARLPGWPASPR